MLFRKSSRAVIDNIEEMPDEEMMMEQTDDVDTVVGPSVSVEGDFASEGNIIVKGTVTGSVHTSKFLLVEPGAKIVANIRAGNAQISGEVKGNIKVKESLEIGSTAKILGDIEAQSLAIEAGAILYGRVVMPGMNLEEGRKRGRGRRAAVVEEIVEEDDEALNE
ncbi:MAG: polymer-forming cytoskeletal protein [bacterium]